MPGCRLAGLAFLAFLASLPRPASATPVMPQLSGSGSSAVYVFALPGSGPRLEVSHGTGARLSSLKLEGIEFLYLDRSSPNWGSTLWPSPQSAWNWPPPDAFDNAAYAGGPMGSALILVGPKDGATQLAITKRIAADDADTSITQVYVIRNGGTASRQVAPWQITRVLPDGLTFFPAGQGQGRGNLASQVVTSEEWNWFDLDAAILPSGTPKYFADGAEGWMAHVDKNNHLLVEVFPDITPSQAAPEEAEIEIYADNGKRYMEIEHQGAYVTLAPGDSLLWTTRWYLRKLPAGMNRTPGDPALMAYASSLARRSTGVRRPPGDAKATASPYRTSWRPATPAFPRPRPLRPPGGRQGPALRLTFQTLSHPGAHLSDGQPGLIALLHRFSSYARLSPCRKGPRAIR